MTMYSLTARISTARTPRAKSLRANIGRRDAALRTLGDASFRVFYQALALFLDTGVGLVAEQAFVRGRSETELRPLVARPGGAAPLSDAPGRGALSCPARCRPAPLVIPRRRVPGGPGRRHLRQERVRPPGPGHPDARG